MLRFEIVNGYSDIAFDSMFSYSGRLSCYEPITVNSLHESQFLTSFTIPFFSMPSEFPVDVVLRPNVFPFINFSKHCNVEKIPEFIFN